MYWRHKAAVQASAGTGSLKWARLGMDGMLSRRLATPRRGSLVPADRMSVFQKQ
jgi:hypothetical protein